MEQYINKSAVVAEIERRRKQIPKDETDKTLKTVYGNEVFVLTELLSFLDTLEVKEFQKKKLYVVTRCEEHSDYVEKAFFSEKEAEEYCKQFEGNEDAYGRDITEIEVDFPIVVKDVDLETFDMRVTEMWGRCAANPNDTIACLHIDSFIEIARHFFELGQLNERKD